VKRLAELTWTEAEKAKDAVVLIPVGATEAHGPHLPLGTDVFISEGLCQRAAVALEKDGHTVLVAPPLAYSVAQYAAGFAGTVSIGQSAAVNLIADVCASLIGQGWAKICLVNSHLEPAHVESLRLACAEVKQRTGKNVAFPDNTEKRWARTLTDEFKRGACHAGSYETSLILAARPDLVRPLRTQLAERPIDLARAMKEGKRTFIEAGAAEAYFGNPAAATAEEGEAIFALLVAMVRQTIQETWDG
jgi:creatinine amidohydrolase